MDKRPGVNASAHTYVARVLGASGVAWLRLFIEVVCSGGGDWELVVVCRGLCACACTLCACACTLYVCVYVCTYRVYTCTRVVGVYVGVWEWCMDLSGRVFGCGRREVIAGDGTILRQKHYLYTHIWLSSFGSSRGGDAAAL